MGAARVLFFATARNAVGRRVIQWEVPDSGIPLEDLTRSLCERYPKLAPVIRISRIVLNDEYVHGRTRPIRPGDEIAIHPPYSGG